MYLRKHSKLFKEKCILRYICGLSICLLTCFEKCMKYLNQNAYIQTAIHSTSFLFATKDAFYLIARNILTIGAVTSISNLALIIIKLFVCSITVTCAYFFMDQSYRNEVIVINSFIVFILFVMYVLFIGS